MRPFVHESLAVRVVFGAGAARERLVEALEALPARRLLVVAGGHERAVAEELGALLGDRVAGRFDGVRPHVPTEVAVRARAAACAAGADALLAIGGGSSIGTAKAVALELGIPIAALPTTYSGSEMTPIWGMTSGGRKETGRSSRVAPRVVVYDPLLTLSLPPRVSGPSAMNALAHCVEALYGPGANPVTTLLAVEGAGALRRGAPAAVARPGELEGRSETLYGAFLGGAAFASAGTGLHHRICHVLGGAYDLPHAETHAVVLPHVVAFFEEGNPGLFTRLAAALEAPRAADGVFALARALDVPASLEAIGLPASELERAVELVLQALPPENPRAVDEAAVRAILSGAHAGARPALAG